MDRERLRSRILPSLALASSLLVAACGQTQGTPITGQSPYASIAHQEQLASEAMAQPIVIAMYATSFHMDPSALTIPAGRPIALTYQNDDTVTHRLTIPLMAAKVLSARDIASLLNASTADTLAAVIKEASDGQVSFAVEPGQNVTSYFIALQAGTYDLQCILPGHSDAGMDAKVFVIGTADFGTLSSAAATQGVAAVAPTPAPGPTGQAMAGMAMPMPTAAAQVSGGHVMAPTTAPGQAHLARDVTLPPVAPGSLKAITFDVADTDVQISPGVTMAAWTFGGQIPGPVVRVRQGDTVQFTLTNHSTMAHSIDFHAACTAPNVNYKNVLPGQSYSFTWTAADPGVFLYHCGSAPILQHLSEGMFGAVIVDPVDHPLPKVDREFVFVQNEFYLTAPQDGKVSADFQKAQTGQADEVVFNGYANQYSDHPIPVRAGEKVRVDLVNAGPNHSSAMHVVGTIFDHVWVDGNPANDLRGIQTYTVAPGDGSAFDFTVSQPGNYPMVTHSFMDANNGAVAVFQAQ